VIFFFILIFRDNYICFAMTGRSDTRFQFPTYLLNVLKSTRISNARYFNGKNG